MCQRTELTCETPETIVLLLIFIMKRNSIPERELDALERRKDGPAEEIDEAVILSAVDGVGPAIDYMSDLGIPRGTALRVLAGPQYHRRPATRTLDRVMELIFARMRRAQNR